MTIKHFVNMDAIPASAVAPGGTITFTYPAGYVGQDFSDIETELVIGSNELTISPASYTVDIGDAQATVTLGGTLSVQAKEKVVLGLFQLESPLQPRQTIGNVRPKVVDKTASFTPGEAEKGAMIHALSDSAIVVTLPKRWTRTDTFVVRRAGTGSVSWTLEAGATLEIPASRAAHTSIAERYDEVRFQVVRNVNGASAVWSVVGATA